MGFVVLCLIFFLCKSWNGFQISTKTLVSLFQGLFQRSHMGYCDEGTLWGVCSEHTSNQRAAWEVLPTPQRCGPLLLGPGCPFYHFWPLTDVIVLNLWWNSEVLEVDRSVGQDCFPCTALLEADNWLFDRMHPFSLPWMGHFSLLWEKANQCPQ